MDIYDKTIDIAHVERYTKLLGPYNRFVIWVHGCCFDCEGCLAENTKNGPFETVSIYTLAKEILQCDVEGITISGGEPFLQAEALGDLIVELRRKKNIGVIVYSGFTIEEIQNASDFKRLLSLIDILIDGKYVKELDDGRAYVGSSNQRIHYLTDRYKEAGAIYYSAKKRKAEIKFTSDKAILVGVPSAEALNLWNKIKEKTGGVVNDF